MKRRTLLKSALALPMLQPTAPAADLEPTAPHRSSAITRLYCGTLGLDYVLGGMGSGEMMCVVGPPSTGKTLVFLDMAARICDRYQRNVVFSSARQPSAYLVRKMTARDETGFLFAQDVCFVDLWDRGVHDHPAVIVVSSSAGSSRAHDLVKMLSEEHPRGCAAFITDGWCAMPRSSLDSRPPEGWAAFDAPPRPRMPVGVKDLRDAKRYAEVRQIPVVMGVTTASLMDDEAVADTLDLSAYMRLVANRMVSLHRPELDKTSVEVTAPDKNVVCLSGTSPHWWGTRCSRLRFDPRCLRFTTVV